MNIIILNTNSFGGNYEYSRCLAKAYADNPEVDKCLVVIPANAAQEENSVFRKILISDISPIQIKVFRKIYFLFKSIVNPLRVFFFLRKQPSAVVIFNDYEQITSFIWVPFFRQLKRRHTFIVILHDPDRDQYLPVKSWSVYTMKKVMSIMDVALYHEILPDKEYYDLPLLKINVPHGIYDFPQHDSALFEELKKNKAGNILLGILGNIRDEKNYRLIIERLPQLPNVSLLIAGQAANSEVPIEEYKRRIEVLGIQNRVIWIEKRLSDEELQAAIKICDGILLYYKRSFTSQSGILNLVAPHKKVLIVSDTPSALTEIVRKFKLGSIIKEDPAEFVLAIQTIFQSNMLNLEMEWDLYIEYASWKNHVQIVLNTIKTNDYK